MECISTRQFLDTKKIIIMSNTLNEKFSGMFPDTPEFRMKSLTPEEKKLCLDKVNAILDNLDDIQGLLGLKEYVRHMSHWQAVIHAIEYKF